jgi:hypothetical protein
MIAQIGGPVNRYLRTARLALLGRMSACQRMPQAEMRSPTDGLLRKGCEWHFRCESCCIYLQAASPPNRAHSPMMEPLTHVACHVTMKSDKDNVIGNVIVVITMVRHLRIECLGAVAWP